MGAMTVRAKFVCNKIEASIFSVAERVVKDDGNGSGSVEYVSVKKEMRTIVMSPVYSDDPKAENKKFWDASPQGELRLGMVNQEAWGKFELGKEYYLDITLAE